MVVGWRFTMRGLCLPDGEVAVEIAEMEIWSG